MTPEDQKVLDQMVELPAAAVAWTSNEITEVEIYKQATMIYANLVSVPRTLQHEQLLELAYQEQGYANATEAYMHGAVQAAFHIKELVEKKMVKDQLAKLDE